MQKIIKVILGTGILFLLHACKGNKENANTEDKNETSTSISNEEVDGNFFSIKEFLDERQEDEKGQPYVLLKIVTRNGKKDSSYIPASDTLWNEIKVHFEDADISDKKFLNKYNAEIFEDPSTESVFLQYKAKEDDVTVRKTDIAVDIKTQRITSVYIEVNKKSTFNTKIQKLLYTPEKIIQIQNFEKATLKKAEEDKIEYRYEY